MESASGLFYNSVTRCGKDSLDRPLHLPLHTLYPSSTRVLHKGLHESDTIMSEFAGHTHSISDFVVTLTRHPRINPSSSAQSQAFYSSIQHQGTVDARPMAAASASHVMDDRLRLGVGGSEMQDWARGGSGLGPWPLEQSPHAIDHTFGAPPVHLQRRGRGQWQRLGRGELNAIEVVGISGLVIGVFSSTSVRLGASMRRIVAIVVV